ncbi:hypothetical protein JCM19275_9 [Nonlabens ulvanivorans]|uniref:Uncharacterized protein n=1 Tax=Nonlabens ulvanivorans TaxID=906888 RepID=A0A081DDL8_NONUL|nr:hypothetical protein JCM19296_2618 [Nonlabens ulvanivorans]GAL00888.1 hypothetical protein JCM19314_114 [Nonlabens ulvanivorans]GAL77058.1 hypothetical protein JCM19275_9 [Nonlabens ulvanivorans]
MYFKQSIWKELDDASLKKSNVFEITYLKHSEIKDLHD